MTITAPHGQAVVWLPIPTLVTIVKRNCRVPQQFVDIDCKPLSIPNLSAAEAPEVLDVKLRMSDFHYIYRLWNDQLWSPARCNGENLAPVAFAAAIQEMFRESFRQRSYSNMIQPDNPCLIEELSGPRLKPPEPIELSAVPLREAIEEGNVLRELSRKHASETLILVDGIVHHRMPEPVFVVSDADAENSRQTRVSFTMPRLSKHRGESGRFSRRDEWTPWLEFRANELPRAMEFARSRGKACSTDLEQLQYSFESFPSEGLHGCSVTAGLVERAFGLIQRGAGAIGLMSDAAMLAFMELRHAVSGLKARMTPAEVRAIDPDQAARIQLAIIQLAGAVMAVPASQDLRSSDAEFVFRRACLLSRERELMSGNIDTDPSLSDLAA